MNQTLFKLLMEIADIPRWDLVVDYLGVHTGTLYVEADIFKIERIQAIIDLTLAAPFKIHVKEYI